MRIGVFDSGLGGLTVLSALRQTVPEAEYVYLGDSARTPYGSKSASTVVRYSLECARFLLSHDIDLLVVACNSASALALEVLEKELSCPIIGTIKPALAACLEIPGLERVGVIGTNATISSQAYQKALRAQAPKLEVISRACPLFVPLVEEGLFEGKLVEEVISHYLSSLSEHNIQCLLLACTHYPLLSPGIAKFLGGRVRIIDCAQAIAKEVLVRCPQPGSTADGGVRYYVTDEPGRFNQLAKLLVDGEVCAVKLEEL
jgi:glutamate racemase